MTSPVLIACAHGTRDARGRSAIGGLVAAIGAARPALALHAAYVDVQPPSVVDVVARVTDEGRAAVVVPLLLSTGYHVGVDVARAVDGRTAVAAPALGPDDRLTALLLQRIREAGVEDDEPVVVAAAGSSDPRAAADVGRLAAGLRTRRSGPVAVGFGASATPTVPDAVAALRSAEPGRRVAVAAYLLAAGHFHHRLLAAGADVVTDPLLRAGDEPDPRLVAIALDRYDAAAATLTG